MHEAMDGGMRAEGGRLIGRAALTRRFIGWALGLGLIAAATCASGQTVPGAPTIGTATGGNAQATVSFTTPSSNGGAAITDYTLTSPPGAITGTGTASPITVTGLTNGTAYTFTVTATDAVRTGPASSAS